MPHLVVSAMNIKTKIRRSQMHLHENFWLSTLQAGLHWRNSCRISCQTYLVQTLFNTICVCHECAERNQTNDIYVTVWPCWNVIALTTMSLINWVTLRWAQLAFRLVTVCEYTIALWNKPNGPTQPRTFSNVGKQYWPNCSGAHWLGNRQMLLIHSVDMCRRLLKLHDSSLTRAITDI